MDMSEATALLTWNSSENGNEGEYAKEKKWQT
jgi:hypothetical protein